jgi:hypothetical protein
LLSELSSFTPKAYACEAFDQTVATLSEMRRSLTDSAALQIIVAMPTIPQDTRHASNQYFRITA